MNLPCSPKPLFIVLLGIGFLTYLVSFLSGPLFFTVDGGIKYLMVRQFATGNLSMALILPFAEEASKLWDYGFYPFDIPFVYDFSGKHVMSFPVYFSFLTAPFVSLLDWRGLYVIPALSIPILWFWMIYCSRQLQMNAITVSLMLLAIIFCSPLTLYGAMFWEHAPAVLCAAMSLCLLFGNQNKVFRCRYMTYGAITGVGVFFRPEVMVMTFVIITISFAIFKKNRFKEIYFYTLGFFCLVAVFFIINLQLYGHILGLHSDQVINQDMRLSEFIKELLIRVTVLEIDFFKSALFNLFIYFSHDANSTNDKLCP